VERVASFLRGSASESCCIEIISAQWGIETGWGKSCHCYNFGNARPGSNWAGDVVLFRCNELLPKSVAERYAKSDSQHYSIADPKRSDGRVWLWCDPPSDGSQFRAFQTVDAGATDHIALLAKNFAPALTAAKLGKAELYAHALKICGYYTADESAYAAGLTGCLRAFQGLPINWDELPILTNAGLEEINSWIAVGTQLMVENVLDWAAEERRKANEG
jgi:hypothetical protein